MRHRIAAIVASASLLLAVPAFAQYTQQGSKLVGTGATGNAMQGEAVALSSDGNTAIVGGPNDNSGGGAAWIWTRSGTTWSQQGAKLVGVGGVGGAREGISVALSADGNTAIVGGDLDDSGVGAAWIFTRSGSTWTQQGAKLVGGGAAGAAFQGRSVAISADGNTALVGGFNDNVSVGAAWVFTRSAGTWTQQGRKLVGTTVADNPSRQGVSVALSADGNLALVGGDSDNAGAGAAWTFSRSGSTWTQQGGKLTGAGATATAAFGHSVALSADGLVAVIGGPNHVSSQGSVWTFSRSGSTWTQQAGPFLGSEAIGPAHQGAAVALSSNGSMMIESGYSDGVSPVTGAAWMFKRIFSTAWTPVGSKLVGTGAVNGSTGANQGISCALSSDGLTAIVGGNRDNSDAGAAWIFAATLPALPPHALADFDGDHKADVTLFKANGDWTSRTSTSSFVSSSTVNWPGAGSIPMTGDYDGDGKQDPALYDPATGHWLIANSTGSGLIYAEMGGAGFTAVPGDYDGDGRTNPAVYNTTTGQWTILNSSGAVDMSITWGGTGFTAIGGQDFDGDFIADIAVYRRSSGEWAILKSSTAFTTALRVNWGGPGYSLVPGDYDGDRKADLGLYQLSTGWWYVLKSNAGFTTTVAVNWGGPGYAPVPGDYDGDGKYDVGLYRPATGTLYALLSGSSYTSSLTVAAGGSFGDVPVSSAISFNDNDTMRATDFDADGRAEMTIYNATTGMWSSLTSSSNYVGATNRGWGGAGYVPAPGDYDGDGRTDLGLYQTTSGNWYVLLSGANFTTSLSKNSGGTGWVPVSGDYDGDGKTDLVVYNTTTGQWYGLKSGSNYTTTVNISFGGTGYVAVPGDFDGDGRSDIAVYRTATGVWSVLLSTTNYTTSLSKNVGGAGDVPVQADYDGDGKTDFVVYNTSTGAWSGLKSASNYTTTINISWGGAGHTPVKGDYDGDGKTDVATYMSSTGNWYILLSGANYTTTMSKSWGGAAYTAVPQYP